MEDEKRQGKEGRREEKIRREKEKREGEKNKTNFITPYKSRSINLCLLTL